MALVDAHVFSHGKIAVTAENAFKQACAACNREDHVGAFPLFLIAAEQGNAEAQYALGLMFINGRGAPTDYVEGAKWFRRGAEQGDVDCLYDLPPLKWSSLKYGLTMEDEINGSRGRSVFESLVSMDGYLSSVSKNA